MYFLQLLFLYYRYFCFEKINYGQINSYQFYIAPNEKIPFQELYAELCNIEYIEKSICHEVDISLVVNYSQSETVKQYLPSNHPHRILFRKQRINKLLNSI